MNLYPKFVTIRTIICIFIAGLKLIHGQNAFAIDEDAKRLNKWINDLPSIWKETSEIYPSRTCAEREKLRERYKELYKEDLVEAIFKAELKYESEDVQWPEKMMHTSFLFCNASFLGYQLYLIHRMGYNPDSILDIVAEMSLDPEVRKRALSVCDTMLGPDTQSNDESDEKGGPCASMIIKHYYKDVANIYEELLVKKSREPNMNVDEEKAKETAHAVIKERKKWGDDRSDLDTALMTNSIPQLRVILKYIDEFDKHTLSNIIERKMQEDKKFIYLNLTQYYVEREDYYLCRLHTAFTQSNSVDVVRIIIQFLESGDFLKNLFAQYEKKYNVDSFWYQVSWLKPLRVASFMLPFIEKIRPEDA